MKKLGVLLCGLVVLLFCAAPAFGATLYVDDDAAPGGDGSAGQPFATIQEAINAASPTETDTIEVSAGTYTENLVWESKSIILMGVAGADVTIVDGSSAASSCLIMRGVPDTARVEGFTFTGGVGIPWVPTQPGLTAGGGLNLDSSSPTLAGNTVTGNSVTYWGGGLYVRGGSPTLTGNSISGNVATWAGGGLYSNNSSPTLTANTIANNSADRDGGGLYVTQSSPTVTSNTITGNTALHSGGGVSIYYSSGIVTENSITDNSGGSGGGLSICAWTPDTVTVANNTITRNSAKSGGGVHVGGMQTRASDVALTNNTITDNWSGNGGGVSVSDSSPTLKGNTITGNWAAVWGGGIHLIFSGATVEQNIISANSSNCGVGYGGGIQIHTCPYASQGSPLVRNNVVTMNRGDGVYCIGSSPTIQANEITGNTENGIALECKYLTNTPSEAEITGNTISGNGKWGIECEDTAAANADSLEANNTLGSNGLGQVVQYWYGLVKVEHADGSAAFGASVSILRDDGDTTPDCGSPFTTSAEGYAPDTADPTRLFYWSSVTWPAITEFEVDNAGLRSTYTPQTIEASLGDEFGTLTHSWDGRLQVPVVTLVPINTPPLADADPDQTVEGSSPTGTPVQLDGSSSSDPDEDPLTYTWAGPFPEGGGGGQSKG